MQTISVKGEEYVKGTDIAKELGYTADYVGQLCRADEIICTKVGRSWYVTEESIREHKKNRYRSTSATSKKEIRHAKERSQEQKEKNSSVTSFGQPHWSRYTTPASYETDDTDLLPQIPKEDTQTPQENEPRSEPEAVTEQPTPEPQEVQEPEASKVVIRRTAPPPARPHRPTQMTQSRPRRVQMPDYTEYTLQKDSNTTSEMASESPKRSPKHALRGFVITVTVGLSVVAAVFISGLEADWRHTADTAYYGYQLDMSDVSAMFLK